jgi:hypothetical protein
MIDAMRMPWAVGALAWHARQRGMVAALAWAGAVIGRGMVGSLPGCRHQRAQMTRLLAALAIGPPMIASRERLRSAQREIERATALCIGISADPHRHVCAYSATEGCVVGDDRCLCPNH